MTQTYNLIECKKVEESVRRNEQYNRMLFDESISGLVLCRMNGELVDVNPAFAAIIGRTVEATLKLSYWDITPERYVTEEKAQLKSLKKTGRYESYVKEYIHSDGHLVPVRLSGRILENEGERFIWSYVEDITKQRDAEKALSRSEVLELLAKGASLQEILSALVTNAEKHNKEMLCSVLLLDADGRHLRHGAAPSLPDFYNDAIDGIEIKPGADYFGAAGAAAQNGKRVIVEDIVNHPDWKSYRELAEKAQLRACWSEPIISSNGNILGTFDIYYRKPRTPSQIDLEFIQDSERLAGIAIERKQADDKIRASESKLRGILDSLQDVYCRTDIEGKIVMVSPSARFVTGYYPEELIGKQMSVFWRYPEQRQQMLQAMQADGGIVHNYEVEGVRNDGSIAWGSISAHFYRNEYGEFSGIEGTLRDVTVPRHREEELARFKAILDQTKDCVFMYRADSLKFFYVNQGAVEQTGYEKNELLQMGPLDIKPDFDEESFHELISPLITGEKREQAFGTYHRSKSGRLIPVDVLLQYIKFHDEEACFVSIVRDITERKRAIEQVRQHQADLAHMARLNMMGEMATGIAHEINQPLAAINNYAAAGQKMLDAGVKSPALLREALEGVSVQAIRAGEIIRRLRQYIKKQEPKKAVVGLNGLVEEVLSFTRSEIRKQSVQIQCELSEKLPNIYADAIQIEQVLINLLHNGFDAMAHAAIENRQITIRTYLSKEGLAQVEVVDTGLGMDSEILKRIFDPFVSTKGDKGMGMGLAICRTIIEAHGGQLWAKSVPGKGASFFFTIPLMEE